MYNDKMFSLESKVKVKIKKMNSSILLLTASDGTNVVKMFNEAVKAATEYKKNPVDIEDQILEELEQM